MQQRMLKPTHPTNVCFIPIILSTLKRHLTDFGLRSSDDDATDYSYVY